MKFVNKTSIRKIKIRSISYFTSINESPLIILGNQKTGTSIITHLLADYGGLSKTVDIPDMFSPTLEKLISGKIKLRDFAQKYSYYFSKSVIKEPNLTFLFDQLLKLHPQANYLFITRDPRSNIRSVLNRLSIPGDLKQIDDSFTIDSLWQHIFDASLWNLPDGNYIEILAHRWNKATLVYKNHSTKMNLVKYEDFNANKIYIITNTANKLGIDKKHDIANEVNVQYQPKGESDVRWVDFFGKKNLKKIEKICSDYMNLFGYN